MVEASFPIGGANVEALDKVETQKMKNVSSVPFSARDQEARSLVPIDRRKFKGLAGS
jgi:hypothetical protein